jgi:hypothetical protein
MEGLEPSRLYRQGIFANPSIIETIKGLEKVPIVYQFQHMSFCFMWPIIQYFATLSIKNVRII